MLAVVCDVFLYVAVQAKSVQQGTTGWPLGPVLPTFAPAFLMMNSDEAVGWGHSCLKTCLKNKQTNNKVAEIFVTDNCAQSIG